MEDFFTFVISAVIALCWFALCGWLLFKFFSWLSGHPVLMAVWAVAAAFRVVSLLSRN